jgi:hypothetical protein
MAISQSIHDYLRMFAGELGERILQTYPALHGAQDPVSPRLVTLMRKPFPAQAVAAMGVAKKWETDRSAAVIAECGTGKTLISLAALHVHSDGRPFTGIVMCHCDDKLTVWPVYASATGRWLYLRISAYIRVLAVEKLFR